MEAFRVAQAAGPLERYAYGPVLLEAFVDESHLTALPGEGVTPRTHRTVERPLGDGESASFARRRPTRVGWREIFEDHGEIEVAGIRVVVASGG